jgi:hypothetical protein
MIKLSYGSSEKSSDVTVFIRILELVYIFSITSTLAFVPISNNVMIKTNSFRCNEYHFWKMMRYRPIPFHTTDESNILMMAKKKKKQNYENENDESSNARKQNKFSSNYTNFADISTLNKRIARLWSEVFEHELRLPPNPNLSPTEFVSIILRCLHEPDDPLPNSGYRSLIRSSSSQWLSEIHKSLGAPVDGIKEEILASALRSALNRPNNQFGILVNADDAEDYELTFRHMIDYEDGTCWIESRLLQKQTKKLLVIIGWQLIKRPYDSAWTIDGLHWQDFREKFRPGIGREEWTRLID